MVADAKITGYLLDATHPDGGPKARFFLGHGFRAEDPETFRRALVEHAAVTEMTTMSGRGGTKFVGVGPLRAPNGQLLSLMSVWALDDDQPPPRLVTAYPAGRRAL